MVGTEHESEQANLHERLHAARRVLCEAYERRDDLMTQIEAVKSETDVVVRPGLVIAFRLAERAVLAAETAMKDAEYALATTGTSPQGDQT